MVLAGGAAEILLPWDPQYEQTAGAGCRVLPNYPDYIESMPSRIRFARVT
jgi:hypothetical protein